jgi:hypothetical protein|nr:MAG TPA: homing endonuclease [Caudoviricetes sp.]DAM42420.1 MAG TPA: homing endonuclease [Caudoviricetes sp.]
MEEIWKDIKEYEGLYQVSNLGRVKRVTTGRILKGSKDRGGYLVVNLSKNNSGSMKKIHRLVAQAFIPNPENKAEINHIDEDKTNNMLSNLDWMTRKENNNHGTRTDRMAKTRSIPIIAINLKTNESTEFYGASECARKLGLHQPSITHVLNGRRKQTGGYTFKYKEERK